LDFTPKCPARFLYSHYFVIPQLSFGINKNPTGRLNLISGYPTGIAKKTCRDLKRRAVLDPQLPGEQARRRKRDSSLESQLRLAIFERADQTKIISERTIFARDIACEKGHVAQKVNEQRTLDFRIIGNRKSLPQLAPVIDRIIRDLKNWAHDAGNRAASAAVAQQVGGTRHWPIRVAFATGAFGRASASHPIRAYRISTRSMRATALRGKLWRGNGWTNRNDFPMARCAATTLVRPRKAARSRGSDALSLHKHDIFPYVLVMSRSLVPCGMHATCRGPEPETHMRLNIRTNLKVILSAVGVAALLASPVMAKSHAHVQQAAPSIVNVPYDAHASVAPYRPAQAVTVYAPDVRLPAHENGLNPDFQLSHE
jgi:hypothetical protein